MGLQVPDTATVKATGAEGKVLTVRASIQGLPAQQFWVLRMDDGEIKFYANDAVEALQWRSA